MKPFVLETARLRLDSPAAADRELVVEYCQDPLFERYLTLPWPYTGKDADFFLETLVPRGWNTDSEYTWALRLRQVPDSDSVPQSDSVPGSASAAGSTPAERDGNVNADAATASSDLLGVIGFRTGASDIGFWIGEPHRGKGYVTEAMAAVMAWLFSTGVSRIAWECVAGNAASASVARKSGFRFTGERLSTQIYRDGTRVPSWHGVRYRDDTGAIHGGWPIDETTTADITTTETATAESTTAPHTPNN